MLIDFNVPTSAVPKSRPGYPREVNDVLARHLIDQGVARAVQTSALPAGEPETATDAAPETAAARPKRRRGIGGLFPGKGE